MPEVKVDIEASLKVIEAATPGPWEFGIRDDGSMWLSLGDPRKGPHRQGDWNFSKEDAAFIVAARDPLTGWEAALKELAVTQLERDAARIAEMRNYLKSPAMETFANLKHSNAGIVLAMLGDGAISRGKCCEALAQLAHGVPFDDIPLPEEKGRQFSEDEIPSEVVERLEKEMREARAELKRRDEPVKPVRTRALKKDYAHCICQFESTGAPYIVSSGQNFCPGCGRKLDWGK